MDARVRRLLGVALIALALVAAASGAASAQDPVRIGGSLGLTGQFAALGQTQERGYRLCVKHANDKGGVLGRRLDLALEDDQSKAPTAVAIYQRLLGETRVDLVLSPYSSPITEAVADITEKGRAPMVAAGAATTSIFRKGRRCIFMLLSPAEVVLEGLVDMAARRGLKTLAVVHEDTLFPKAIAQGTADLARRRGLQVTLVEAYPRQTTEFAAILARVKAANVDVLAAATYFEDSVAITRQMKALDLNPKMFAVTVGGDLPKFYETLGRAAEFVYGATQWEPELVTLRAGGLVPIARQYPGAREFVEAYQKEFPGADLSYQTAQAYGACQLLLDAVRRAGSLDGDRVRDVLARTDLNTVFGPFKVDKDGFQVAHKMLMFQWQDGKKLIVWPDDLAPGKPRFPTPPWSHR
jgi:branched-chain amino acid transport system substrate-binding protein